ncbi:MAG TPA: ABC transporter substrate binding protein, partial [Methanotrichaceae archaeon]|nr:ABC transporter substrate binding protein [Methanotrichaceae archaeon]
MKSLVLASIVLLASLLIGSSAGQSMGVPGDGVQVQHRILVINSYTPDVALERDLSNGMAEGLRRVGFLEPKDYQMKTIWMDTKVNYTGPEEIEKRASMAMDLIDEFKPDLVFLNDDNALQYVAVNYTMSHPKSNVSFIFAGVNVDPTIYSPIKSLDMPGGRITGLLERIPFSKAFALGKSIVPNASTMVLVGDASPSSDQIVRDFKEWQSIEGNNSSIRVLGFIQARTFDEWKDAILANQGKADLLGVLNYYQIRDENGAVLPSSEVAQWTFQNNLIPEIGLIPSNAEDGFMAAAGVSYWKTGIYAGIMGGEILKGHE